MNTNTVMVDFDARLRTLRHRWSADWRRPFVPLLYPLIGAGLFLLFGAVCLFLACPVKGLPVFGATGAAVSGLLCFLFWWIRHMKISIAGVEFEAIELGSAASFKEAITSSPDTALKPDRAVAQSSRPFLSFANFCSLRGGFCVVLSSVLKEKESLFKALVNDLPEPGDTILKIASDPLIDNRKHLVKKMLAAVDTPLDPALVRKIELVLTSHSSLKTLADSSPRLL